jgi:GMP synthase (glutamine-hydrolysing)
MTQKTQLIHQKFAVVDFGGQYAHLIANRLRRLGVYTEIQHNHAPASAFANYTGIIFSGGPSSVYEAGAPQIDPEILNLGIPILGICYGHQLIAQTLGGTVSPGTVKEYGIADLKLGQSQHPLLANLPSASPMWMSHGDKVQDLPEGFSHIAYTDDCDTAAVADDQRKIFGIQFHPEVTHSKFGLQLMENFLDLCGARKDWNMQAYFDEIAAKLKKQAAGKKVFLLVSGGVDSTVAFVLLNQVLGKDQVLGLHIDTGTMRLGESAKVVEFLHAAGMDNLKVVDASEAFLSKLQGITDPETKRKLIGATFLEVKDAEMAQLNLNPAEWLLAQGTIYPDTIESGGTQNADTIKTHHNRVQEILDLMAQGGLVEPLAELYKDEVRELGEQIGIPHDLVWRHPFPGPGLGVRLLCSDGNAQGIRTQDAPGLLDYLSQNQIEGFLVPIKSVGVQGDARSYAQPIVLKGPLAWDICEQHATAIPNRFHAVNRAVLHMGGPWTEPTLVEQYCQRQELDFLRRVDDVCTVFLQEKGLYDQIWQMPVVLLPLQIEQKPVIVLRPVESSEAMTANFYPMDQELMAQLWVRLEQAGAGAVWYDITHKPPGTIEWE